MRRTLSAQFPAVVVSLVLVLLAIGVSSASTPASEGSADIGIPPGIEGALQDVFSEERCTTAAEARSGLPPSILQDWTIADGTKLRSGQCVATRADTEGRRLVLIPALSPEVRVRMEDVTQELIERCFAEDDAVRYVTGVLTELGDVDFEIRTDGPLTAPVDQVDEVRAHVQAGCWVYSGTGWNDQGHRYYYVSGLGASP